MARMAVAIAEGVGGSIGGFADLMNANARRLGMSQSNFVNPNGLPAENHITSARDLAILARALIREFPEYDSYWHISSIRYGNRVMRNYNSLIDRYPGADGMITVSGFKVFPNEVEEVAMSQGGLLECAVVGVPDQHSGEVPKLFAVKKDPNLTAADLRAFLASKLASYKIPRQIEFREELPKTNVGKILRRALRDDSNPSPTK